MPQNELEKTLGKVIDQKVMPELKAIKEKLSKHDEEFKSHGEKLDMLVETVADVKVDVTEMKEDISDMGYTTERIETRLNSVIKDQDEISLKTRQLNRRVLRLEAKKT